MNARQQGSNVALWIVLTHWYGLAMVIGFECIQQNGAAWLGRLPWHSWGREVAEIYLGQSLSAGALLLLVFFSLLLVSLLVLVYDLATMRALHVGVRDHTVSSPSMRDLMVASPAQQPLQPALQSPMFAHDIPVLQDPVQAQRPSAEFAPNPMPAAPKQVKRASQHLMTHRPELAPMVERLRHQLNLRKVSG
jgi:hypothetical protein